MDPDDHIRDVIHNIRREIDENAPILMKCFGQFHCKDCNLILGMACIFEEKCKTETEKKDMSDDQDL